MNLVNGDCLEYLAECERVKCIFADPPDNIGLGYNQYKDKMLPQHYYLWLEKLIGEALYKCEIFWLSYNAIHDLEVTHMVRQLLVRHRASWKYDKIIWHYTFGQYNDHDFGTCYRPMIRLMMSGTTTYPDAVREESERMRLGDNRAAGPRVPGDVWEYPRVTGNSIERQSWHCTQHPVALYDRIIKFSCKPPQTFLDLFAGSGTCFRAGRLNPNVNIVGVEIDGTYCSKIQESMK